MIRIVEDVVAPFAVAAVDIAVEKMQPTWSEWAKYGMAAGGYVATFMGFGGDFAKNVGIAALPLATKALYNRLMPAGTQSVGRLAFVQNRQVANRVAITRSYQPEMEQAGAF